MVRRECESIRCLSKNYHRRAVWMIDRVPHCNPCFQRWLEENFLDEHRVIRLSEREEDFSEGAGTRDRPPKKGLEFVQRSA